MTECHSLGVLSVLWMAADQKRETTSERKTMCTEGGSGHGMSNMSMEDGVSGGGGSGDGDNPTFTLDGLSQEYKVGDVLTEEDALKIVAASNGQLKYENGVITGKNHDGTGDVYIVVGQPLGAGEIHDLHHTVPGSGGAGKG